MLMDDCAIFSIISLSPPDHVDATTSIQSILVLNIYGKYGKIYFTWNAQPVQFPSEQ